MLTTARSLTRFSQSGTELPRVAAFKALYEHGCLPRSGQVIMVVGRSGSGKSLFAIFWTVMMDLPTLYISGDMSPFTASTRVTSVVTGETDMEVEMGMLIPEKREEYLRRLAEVQLTFAFGAPITWHGIDEELQAYVELWDKYPEVIVIDNLKEFDHAESEYKEQMAVMAGLTDLARATGSTVIVMHHASDKGAGARDNPGKPPGRSEIKNGLSENPELALSVALDERRNEFNIAVLKQRSGRSDPEAQTWITLTPDPARTRFYAKED